MGLIYYLLLQLIPENNNASSKHQVCYEMTQNINTMDVTRRKAFSHTEDSANGYVSNSFLTPYDVGTEILLTIPVAEKS
jgi:hypothetical protein